jgi:hypothetical protein
MRDAYRGVFYVERKKVFVLWREGGSAGGVSFADSVSKADINGFAGSVSFADINRVQRRRRRGRGRRSPGGDGSWTGG